MVNTCCAFNCNSRHFKGCGFSFHTFPRDKKLREKWVLATRRKNFVPSNTSTICSKHFEKSCYMNCFGQIKLKKTAIPSKFSFPDSPKIRSKKVLLSQEEWDDMKRKSSSTEGPKDVAFNKNILRENSMNIIKENDLEVNIGNDPLIIDGSHDENTNLHVNRSGENIKSSIIYRNICRLCLQRIPENPVHIWDDNQNYFGKKISLLCGIVTTKYDFLTSLCQKCALNLDYFDQFRTECLKNNEALEEISHIETIKQKCESTYSATNEEYLFKNELSEENKILECLGTSKYIFEVQSNHDKRDNEDRIIFKNSKDFLTALEDNQIEFQGKVVVFECDLCPAIYEGENYIKEHIDSHILESEKTNYKCHKDKCGAKFTSYSKFSLHLKDSHNVQVKSLCQLCGKFTSLNHIYHKHKPTKRKIQQKQMCQHCSKQVHNITDHIEKMHSKKPAIRKIYCKKLKDSRMRSHTFIVIC